MSIQTNVAVIGGGPAGLAAAIAAAKQGAQVLLIEREARLGGILKQCVHDGFGVLRFGEKLAGPEYAQRFLNELRQTNIQILTQTFVDKIKPHPLGWKINLVTAQGMRQAFAKAVVFATGCRERTARQIGIHGTRPAGVLTAGSAQFFTNILGQLPGRRCVILGSGDIGMIMARRLTLEGAQVQGVYEARGTPSGLPRNVAQCLHDFNIPLHLRKTVTRCFGYPRLEAVEIASVDEHMQPIAGTEERVDCDALILSVGLIPENELLETLRVPIDPVTRGPVCDQYGMVEPGLFCCGNAAHVNDLVDYVSESGEIAGAAAASYTEQPEQQHAQITAGQGIMYAVPQRIALPAQEIPLYFRVKEELGKSRVVIRVGETVLAKKTYLALRPPEMERIMLDLSQTTLQEGDEITVEVQPL
ncbi:MAG: NAD(P)/FAD-dependent oxidoreductase [Oscillospiraceae bacterium]|nr:NAD(P)/FAD-dependent oxidoreductase [Oscillospiraceae bacterium]